MGKTTTCVNLAASRYPAQVLVIDPGSAGAMPWAVASTSTMWRTAYELLIEDAPIGEVIIPETSGGYHLIAANADVTAAEIRLMEFLPARSACATPWPRSGDKVRLRLHRLPAFSTC